MHPLSIVAGVLAVASLVFTALFVHDRRQRVPQLLLSAGVICLIVAPLFGESVATYAILAGAIVLVVTSTTLSIRNQRARID